MGYLNFSDHLFWDVDVSFLDPDKHSKYIIKNVLQYGSYNDFKEIKSMYGLKKIVETAKTIKDLDKKTATFLSVLTGEPKERFICYTTTQSLPQHWNF